MTTVKEVLLKAADLLGEKGWCQGALMKHDGSMCALGAMGEARAQLMPDDVVSYDGEHYISSEAHAIYGRAYTALIKQINPHAHMNSVSIPGWNDDPDRTAEDVILILKRAAEAE